MKLTTWFDAAIEPARPGWYQVFGHFWEVRGSKGVVMRHWDGRHWFWRHPVTGVLGGAAVTPGHDKWRGLRTKDGK